MKISACIPTRGDVDLAPILEPLPLEWEVFVWNNAVEVIDYAVFGRYAAIIAFADGDVVFTQDDDCVVSPEAIEALLAAYEPGYLAAVMPPEFRPGYPDSCLVGFGALFDRRLPFAAFRRFEAAHGEISVQDLRLRCDVIFSALTPLKLVDAPVEILPYARGPGRMYGEPSHGSERTRVLELARAARDQACV